MKRLLLLSLSIFLLTLSAALVFHMDSEPAEAQGGMIVGFAGSTVLLDNGDVWFNSPNTSAPTTPCPDGSDGDYGIYCKPAVYVGNFWTGTGTVSTSNSTMGSVKSLFGK